MHRRYPIIIFLLAVGFLNDGCSIRRITRRSMMDFSDNLSTAMLRQPDPALAREGGATFLLVIDSMIQKDPRDTRYLLAGVQAYTAYASAFLLDSDPSRAYILYDRALNYGFRLCELNWGIDSLRKRSATELAGFLQNLDSCAVPALYWTATAWSGWIITNPDQMLGIADLSLVVTIMGKTLELDPVYQSGGPHMFFALYYASRPPAMGGNLEKSKRHFEELMEIAGPEALMPRVLYARYYARLTLNEDLFVETLQSVLKAPPPENADLNLMNAIAKKRAADLLIQKDDFF
ncbi:hypothetical protein JXA40_07415 [bacterium]|nr:hypothetical protein [candidate division CSSED10-310 bacterium]